MKTEATSEESPSKKEAGDNPQINLSLNDYPNIEDQIVKDQNESNLEVLEKSKKQLAELKKSIIKNNIERQKFNELKEIQAKIENLKSFENSFYKWTEDANLVPRFLFENEETSMYKFQKDLLKTLIMYIRKKIDCYKEILNELENSEINHEKMQNFKSQFFYFVNEEIKFVKEKLSQQTLDLPFKLYQDFEGKKYLTLKFSRSHPYSFGIVDQGDERKSLYVGSLIDGQRFGLGFLLFTQENFDSSNFYFGQFDNKRTGIGLRNFSEKGEKYFGEFFDDKFSSFGKYYLPMLRDFPENLGQQNTGINLSSQTNTKKIDCIYAFWKGSMIEKSIKVIFYNKSIYEGGIRILNKDEITLDTLRNFIAVGPGKLTTANGEIFMGNFTQCFQFGTGTIISALGEYKGTWKNEKPHSFDNNTESHYKYKDGSDYKGFFFEDQYHGKGTWKDLKGNSYSGDWEYNYRHGIGSSTSEDGIIYVGAWDHNEKTGHGKETRPNSEYFIGEFLKGAWIRGTGKIFLTDGRIYEGEMVNRIPEGYGKRIEKNVCTQEGSFVNGKYIKGCLTYFMENFKPFLNSHPNPAEITNFLNKNLNCEGIWDDDKAVNVKGTIYYPNLGIYNGEIVNSLRTGNGRAWHINGESYNGLWQNDLFHGKGLLVSKDLETGQFEEVNVTWKEGTFSKYHLDYSKWLINP